MQIIRFHSNTVATPKDNDQAWTIITESITKDPDMTMTTDNGQTVEVNKDTRTNAAPGNNDLSGTNALEEVSATPSSTTSDEDQTFIFNTHG